MNTFSKYDFDVEIIICSQAHTFRACAEYTFKLGVKAPLGDHGMPAEPDSPSACAIHNVWFYTEWLRKRVKLVDIITTAQLRALQNEIIEEEEAQRREEG